MYTGDGESEEDKGKNNEESKFSFLHDRRGDKGQDSDSSDSEKSSSDEQNSSGFAFLNTTPVSPREAEQGGGDQQREAVEDQQLTPRETGEKVEQKDTSTDSKRDTEVNTPSSEKSSEMSLLLQPAVVKGEESSITSRPPLKVGGGRAVGRQMPPASGAKKKKRKAVIPGKERMATSSSASSQAEPESPSSSKSDLSSRTNDDTAPPHNGISEHSEQLIDIAANPRQDGDEQVESCLTEEVTIQPVEDTSTITEDHVQSSDVALATEYVDTTDTNVQKEPTSEPVTIEIADEEAESHALEEVFGNYRVELSGEESYTALIESYQSSIKKIR